MGRSAAVYLNGYNRLFLCPRVIELKIYSLPIKRSFSSMVYEPPSWVLPFPPPSSRECKDRSEVRSPPPPTLQPVTGRDQTETKIVSDDRGATLEVRLPHKPKQSCYKSKWGTKVESLSLGFRRKRTHRKETRRVSPGRRPS